jgi:hypothetical protein
VLSETEAALLVDLAELPFQFRYQLFNSLGFLFIGGHLPGYAAVPHDLHLQPYTLVFRHDGIPITYN